MPVSPIDYGRYGHTEMVTVFEEEHRHSLWLRIEAAVAEVQAEMKLIPKDAAEQLKLEEYYNNIREVSRRIVKEAQKTE